VDPRRTPHPRGDELPGDREEDVSEPRALPVRPLSLASGAALLLLYERIGVFMGFQADFGNHGGRWGGPMSFLHLSDGELRFFLAHLVLATPGALLVAWGLAPLLEPAALRLCTLVDGARTPAWRIAAIALLGVLLAWSIVGRRAVILDQPITDDETAITFGARMVAEGHLAVPAFRPPGVFTDLYLHVKDGMVSSCDYPGGVFFAAASILTRLGSGLYALASAIGGVACAYAAKRWMGPRAAVLAAAIWLVSPMTASLSITTHAHVPSRMFLAVAFAFAARIDTAAAPRRADAWGLGLAAGLAAMCRPIEAGCVLAPMMAWLIWRALRPSGGAPPDRDTPLRIALGGAPPIFAFAWYNDRVTGAFWLQARFAPGTIAVPVDAHGPWDRLGFNLAFNVIMIAVFFLGIPALALVGGGLDRRPFLRALAAGALLDLSICLAHDNTGIHAVGPIHAQEMIVPLVLLATAGILRGMSWLAARDVPRAPAAILAGAYLAACVLFDATHLASLHAQAAPQILPARVLAEHGVHHAIVLAPEYFRLVRGHPTFAPHGSWVMMYPHPDPFFRDDVIFASAHADPTALRARFPDRSLWRMTYAQDPPILRLAPLADAP
jgi:hypothetical protein